MLCILSILNELMELMLVIGWMYWWGYFSLCVAWWAFSLRQFWAVKTVVPTCLGNMVEQWLLLQPEDSGFILLVRGACSGTNKDFLLLFYFFSGWINFKSLGFPPVLVNVMAMTGSEQSQIMVSVLTYNIRKY